VGWKIAAFQATTAGVAFDLRLTPDPMPAAPSEDPAHAAKPPGTPGGSFILVSASVRKSESPDAHPVLMEPEARSVV